MPHGIRQRTSMFKLYISNIWVVTRLNVMCAPKSFHFVHAINVLLTQYLGQTKTQQNVMLHHLKNLHWFSESHDILGVHLQQVDATEINQPKIALALARALVLAHVKYAPMRRTRMSLTVLYVILHMEIRHMGLIVPPHQSHNSSQQWVLECEFKWVCNG